MKKMKSLAVASAKHTAGEIGLKSAPMSEEDKNPSEYQKSDWTRTLMDGLEVMHNPHKMKHIAKHIDAKRKAFKTLDDIKEEAQGG
jgi:Mor family transcriptional regulator